MPLIDLNGLGHFKDRENAMIAEDFSASKAYAAGDYCYYNGTLYKFKTAHAAGAWTIADVEAAKLAHDVSDLKESFIAEADGNTTDTVTDFVSGYININTGAKGSGGNYAVATLDGTETFFEIPYGCKKIIFDNLKASNGSVSGWALYSEKNANSFTRGGQTSVASINDNEKFFRVSTYNISSYPTQYLKITYLFGENTQRPIADYSFNLSNMTYVKSVNLPITTSYMEAITRLGDYYYAVCRDYTNAPNTSYIAKYDSDLALVSYKALNAGYGIANNIVNDGTRLYVDFDNNGNYHVSFNTDMEDDVIISAPTYRHIVYDNDIRYGISFDTSTITVYQINPNNVNSYSSFTINTTHNTLQSANIIDGVLYVSTTRGTFIFIDVVTKEIIEKIPYYSEKEIECFFKDADGKIKCAGHVYGFDGMFNIGEFSGGVDYTIMQYFKTMPPTLGSSLANTGNARFMKVTNGLNLGFPEDSGEAFIFNGFKWFITRSGRCVYSYNFGESQWEKNILVNQALLNALAIVKTASGNPATFADGANGVALKAITADIVCTQEGTGDASPENIRPINGFNNVVITVKADADQEGTEYTIAMPSTARPIYGGSLAIDEFGNGVLTLDKYGCDMGSLTWEYNSTNQWFTVRYTNIPHTPLKLTGGGQSTSQMGCSILRATKISSAASMSESDDVITCGNNSISSTFGIIAKHTAINTVEDFKTLVAGQTLYYTLAEPLVFNLSCAQVKTLLGNNIISANSGGIALSYIADLKKYIDSVVT